MKKTTLTLVVLLLAVLLLSVPLQAMAAPSPFSNIKDQLVVKTEEEPPADSQDDSPVLAEDSTNEALRAAVAQYLDSLDYSYDYDTERQCFSYTMNLDCTAMSECDVCIFINPEGFKVLAYSNIRPKKDDVGQLSLAAEFLTRANYNMYLGNFEMDHSDSEVRFKTTIKCFDRVPSQKEIEWLVDMPPIMLEKYGDALASVLLGSATPADAVAKAEAND